MPAEGTSITERSPTARSRVTNGSSLFIQTAADGLPIDGRSVPARRFRDVLESILSDLGGRDSISEGEYQLARRATAMSVQSEILEARMACAQSIDIEEFVKLVNGLKRTFTTLGLKRRARDVTPDLKSYIEGKAEVSA